jgi:hypothetical protein
MNESEFWALVESSRGRSIDRRVERLGRELARRPATDITGFADQLAVHLRRLDTPEHASAAGTPPGDAFLSIRCAVVMAGRGQYTKVAESPRAMARYRDADAEPLLTVAQEAYEEATGMAWEHQPPVDVESGTSPAWDGTETQAAAETHQPYWLGFGSGFASRPSREYEVTQALLSPVLNADPAWQDWWRNTGTTELEAFLVIDPQQTPTEKVRRGRKLIRAEVVRPSIGFAGLSGANEPERARADMLAVLKIVGEKLGSPDVPPFPAAPNLPTDL